MSTTFVVHESSTTGSFMLPGMSSPEVDTDGFNASRVVRFDSECVLIPEAMQKKPSLMVTKSYSLPLWRRKGNPQSDSDVEDAASSSAVPPSPEDSRVVIKVPIPLFRRRSSRSPTRGSRRSVSLSPVISKRPPSCLVHRSTSPIAAPLSPVRRPSLPIYHRRKDEMTVPLRACCEACEFATEESLKEGENWHEKFSRGAKRRRSGSLDNQDINSLFKVHTHSNQSSFSKEFSALSASLDTMAESSRYGGSSVFALTVDEVDKRRKSLDVNREPLEPFFASPPSPLGASFSFSSSSPQSPGSLHPGTQRYPRSLGRERDSGSTSSSSPTMEDLMPDILDPRHRFRSSPIEEEDEAQLFPLPSPRRSPSGTPSPRLSPIPSPRASSSSLIPAASGGGTLHGRSACASSSKESVASNSKLNSSQESLLRASFSRKPASVSSGASPNSLPRSPSPLAASATAVEPDMGVEPMKKLSLHRLKISTTPSASERTASGPISPKGPRPPSFSRSSLEKTPTLKNMSTSPPPPQPPFQPPQVEPEPAISFPATPASPPTPLIPLRLPIANPTSSSLPIPTPKSQDSTATYSNTHTRQPSASEQHSSLPHSNIHSYSQSHSHATHTHGHSSSTSPGNSGGMSPVQKRKTSFSLPFIRAGEALRDAGVDMLKGVSSMSGTGVV